MCCLSEVFKTVHDNKSTKLSSFVLLVMIFDHFHGHRGAWKSERQVLFLPVVNVSYLIICSACLVPWQDQQVK